MLVSYFLITKVLVGSEGELGAAFGLDNEWSLRIIEQVGNELFEFLFLNKDLQTTLEQCQKSASRLLD